MIKIFVNQLSALCSKTNADRITTGLVGQEVHFDFSEHWAGMVKTAVFEGSGITKDQMLESDRCTIPPECLKVPGGMLTVGIYGVGEDEIRPTVYCEIGRIERGADPSGDESTDPSLPVWAQIQQQIGDIGALNTKDKSSLVAAINEAISKGASPEAIIAIVVKYLEENPVSVTERDPTVPAWAKAKEKPTYAAFEVGADPEGTAANAVNQHNVDDGSHNDIRTELKALNERLTAFFDSDDQTLDELSEIVEYIKSNKTLIDSITTSKVSVADIINNLVTNVSNKPLSAAQGVALKALIDAIVVPTKLSQLANDSNFITASAAPVQSVNGKTGEVNLNAASVGARPDNWMPTAQDVGALPNTYTPPNQTAAQVGADPAGTAESKVSAHNTKNDAHNDIRLELQAINAKLTAFFDSDNQTLDELSEIVAYITNNKDLIDAITTSKVSVSDIIDNLTTNVSNKPLSAAQGVALKALIDAITVPTKLSQLAGDSTHRTVTDAEKATWDAKSNFSGNYADLNGKPTIPTVPTKVSAFTNDAGYITQADVPVKGTDYWTAADQESMIQDVLAALGGSPILGVVDVNNNIVLSGNLAEGVYSVKYEDAEGNVTEIGTLNNTSAPAVTNLFVPSTATLNTRMSGSSKAPKTENGYVMSALMSIPATAMSGSTTNNFIAAPASMWTGSANMFFSKDDVPTHGYCDAGTTKGEVVGNWVKIPLKDQYGGSFNCNGVTISLKVGSSAITESNIQNIEIYFNEIPE